MDMDHGDMGHGGMHHGDMSGPKCNMNMLFTWDATDLCIIFRQWHVSGFWSLIWSLFAIALLTAGYEAVREVTRQYEAGNGFSLGLGFGKGFGKNRRSADDGIESDDGSGLPLLRGRLGGSMRQQQTKMVKAALYALQVFYSFFIMLLFMTYNGWVMLSVAVGAFIGYMTFGDSSASKSVACH